MNESSLINNRQLSQDKMKTNSTATTAQDLLEVLKALFEHCAMIHNKWGDGSNQREADAAIAAGRAAIAQAEAAQ